MNRKRDANKNSADKVSGGVFRHLRKSIFRKQGDQNIANKYKMKLRRYSSVKDLGIPGVESADDLKRLSQINRLEFAALLASLKKWFQKFDSRYLLSIYVFYGFTERAKRKSREHVPETNNEFSTEILQAVALTHDNEGVIESLFWCKKDLMKEVAAITYLLMFRDLDKSAQHPKRADSIIDAMRSHTTFVRNWTYAHHADEVMTGLLRGVDADIKIEYGMTGSDMVRTFAGVIETLVAKLDRHVANIRELRQQKNMQSMTDFFAERFGDIYHSDDAIKKEIAHIRGFFKLLKLRVMLNELTDIALMQGFSFSIKEIHRHLKNSDIKALERFVLSLSYGFGSLKIENIGKLLLDNPVRKKPFIRLNDGTYFCPLVSSLWDYLPGIIEENIIPSLRNKTQIKYSETKAAYVEDYTANLLSEYFQDALLFKNVIWTRNDQPSERFEIDHLLILGSCALIFESKSSRLTASARRGGLGRLKRHIEDLVLHPSRQNNQFIEAAQKGLIQSTKHQNGKAININLEKVKYYIPIIATLEFASGMQDSRQIFDSGLAKGMEPQEINLRMSMTDLASVFEILPHAAMKIHYLIRRKELESHITLNGIETDFLEFYLHSGFNIGEEEYTPGYHLVLSDTRNLDLYFTTKGSSYEVPMPKPKLTQLWRHLLSELDDKQGEEDWLEASFALLNCGISEQKEFERKMKRFFRKQRFLKRGSRYLTHPTGISQRKILLVAYLHIDGASKADQLEFLRTKLYGDVLQHYVLSLVIYTREERSQYSYECIILGNAVAMESPLKFIEYRP